MPELGTMSQPSVIDGSTPLLCSLAQSIELGNDVIIATEGRRVMIEHSGLQNIMDVPNFVLCQSAPEKRVA